MVPEQAGCLLRPGGSQDRVQGGRVAFLFPSSPEPRFHRACSPEFLLFLPISPLSCPVARPLPWVGPQNPAGPRLGGSGWGQALRRWDLSSGG